MWFKNLQIYRLPAPWPVTADQLEVALAPQSFVATGSLEMQSMGWVAPRPHGKLVHVVDRQLLLLLGREKKLLPTTVINQVAKAKAVELEEQQGFKPGRKQMKELKEQVADELRPRAFSIYSSTFVWIDPVRGWLVVDAGSAAKAEDVLKLLIKAVDKLPLETLHVARSPRTAMTDWLAADDGPGGFTVDQDTELQATGDSKATVRYVRHTIDPDDVRRHIAAGKQCTRLAMTWADRVSFVLTESLAIKRVTPLDVLKESSDVSSKDEDERFDGDFALMTGELSKMIADLVEALGGEENALRAAAA
ncbi:recombination-associated protein RdgC [Lacisediminimonas profundi]|uniref:recombination-associated protein RdgC n=1 Tax=Lacisediminimonas profundi TaxID=2603856 RepID=UPI00124B5ED8|nr:recombination-associated protein RdgC [Lacisediminimonas profundi]